MQQISLYLNKTDKIEQNSARSEYEDILLQFVAEINKPPTKTKMNKARVGMMLSDAGLKKPSDLYFFFNQCKRARNFAAWFKWSLKPPKSPNTVLDKNS